MFFDVYELLKSYTNENFSLHWILWWIFFSQGYGERNLRVLPDGFIKPSWAFLTRYQVWVWRCHFKYYFHISFLGFLQGKCLFGPCPTVSHAYHLMCSLLITNTLKTFIFFFFFYFNIESRETVFSFISYTPSSPCCDSLIQKSVVKLRPIMMEWCLVVNDLCLVL